VFRCIVSSMPLICLEAIGDVLLVTNENTSVKRKSSVV